MEIMDSHNNPSNNNNLIIMLIIVKIILTMVLPKLKTILLLSIRKSFMSSGDMTGKKIIQILEFLIQIHYNGLKQNDLLGHLHKAEMVIQQP